MFQPLQWSRPPLIVSLLLAAGCGRVGFEHLRGGDGGAPADTGTAGVGDAGVDAGADAGNGLDAGGGPTTLAYVATVAECIDPGSPDPAFCRATNGDLVLAVDENDGTVDVPFHAYLRFDLDGAATDREITAVVLEAVVTTDEQAHAPTSGEVWLVDPFTGDDLYLRTPATIGDTPIGADVGAVVQEQRVEWELPVEVVSPDAPLFVGILPTGGDGSLYWNLDGPDPPRLRLELL